MIYEKVETYCRKHKTNISQFEKLCGLGNGAVGKWKSEGVEPKLTTLKRIADATKTSIKYWVS